MLGFKETIRKKNKSNKNENVDIDVLQHANAHDTKIIAYNIRWYCWDAYQGEDKVLSREN